MKPTNPSTTHWSTHIGFLGRPSKSQGVHAMLFLKIVDLLAAVTKPPTVMMKLLRTVMSKSFVER